MDEVEPEPKIEIIIASKPEYEGLIAEMYVNGEFVATINEEAGSDHWVIEFEPRDSILFVPLVTFEEALRRAKGRLAERGPFTPPVLRQDGD